MPHLKTPLSLSLVVVAREERTLVAQPHKRPMLGSKITEDLPADRDPRMVQEELLEKPSFLVTDKGEQQHSIVHLKMPSPSLFCLHIRSTCLFVLVGLPGSFRKDEGPLEA